jgi:hypothetical protein
MSHSNMNMLKSAGVGSLYAALGIVLALVSSFILWQSYDGSRDTWRVYVSFGKIILYLITALVAYLAAQSFHPTRIYGLAAALISALVFRIVVLALAAADNPKWDRYHDGIWETVGGACVLGLFFGLLGLWRSKAQPGAAPNGGPATRPVNSEVTEGPPSVS